MDYTKYQKAKDLKWFEDNKEVIYQKYQSKYVGIRWKKIIAYGNELQAVIDKMRTFDDFIVKECDCINVEPMAKYTDEYCAIWQAATITFEETQAKEDIINLLEEHGYVLVHEHNTNITHIGKKLTMNNQ